MEWPAVSGFIGPSAAIDELGEPWVAMCYLSAGKAKRSVKEMQMKRVALFLVLGAIAAISARTSAMIPEQIKIDTGLIAGTTAIGQASVRVFKGIPFAAPPLGENRWRAPQPAAKWDGVRNADAFGAPCTSGPAAGRGAGSRRTRARPVRVVRQRHAPRRSPRRPRPGNRRGARIA